jgi:D5 N terminal like
MPSLSTADQELRNEPAVKPATIDQRLKPGLSNPKIDPPPQKQTAAPVASRGSGANENSNDSEGYNKRSSFDKSEQTNNENIFETPAPRFSEEDLALRFVRRYGSGLRYVAPWGKWLWLRPGGGRWIIDDALYVFDLVRQVCREAAAECVRPWAATAIASAKTVAAVEKLVRSDRRIAATVDQWDADPWLLNTPAAAIDLRSGASCGRRAQAYLTKSTAVRPSGSCPLFREFLKRATDGNDELETFLQRIAGYCLTGSTREHALFFLYGTGATVSRCSSTLCRASWAIMRDRPRSRPSPPRVPKGTRRTSPACVVPAL